jgi:hypothetical protein
VGEREAGAVRLTIRTKLVVAVVAGLLVVAAVAAGLMRFVYARGARLAADVTIRNAAASYSNLEKNEADALAVGLHALAANPELERLFRARDRAGLLRVAAPTFELLRERQHITHWYFIQPDGTVFLRMHAPGLHGDVVERPTLLRAHDTGELATGKELGKTAFALRAVLPWRGAGGELVGYLELSQEIEDFLATMKEQTGDDYALFVDKAHVDAAAWAEQKAQVGERNDWDDHPHMVLVSATATGGWPPVSRVSHNLAPAGERIELPEQPEDRVVGVFPTRDASGHAVGAVFVRHEARSLRAGLANVRGPVVATVVVLAGGLAALVVFLLDTLVFDRIRRMSDLFEGLPERIARGDYHLEIDPEPPRDDELGRFELVFHRAVEVIAGALREIEHGSGPGDRRGPRQG